MSSQNWGGKRIGWIDAMRGFSIILVVFGHVLLKMGFPTTSTTIGSILLTFRMPLFFFISGFFAYRAFDKWSLGLAKSVVKRKIQAQVICTIVFYALFQICHNKSILAFLSDGFSWFWFTVVLCQMFQVYLILAITETITKCNKIVNPALIILSIILFYIHVRGTNITLSVWKIFSWYFLTEYFQFFAMGIFARKYIFKFQKLLQSDYFRTIVIGSYIILLILAFGLNGWLNTFSSACLNLVHMVFVRYAGLMTVFIVFYSYNNYFDGNGKPVKWLKFVGRRTLDIYMLHVFLLPNLIFLKEYLNNSGGLLLQLAIGMSFTIINVAVCLILSNVIRTSKFFSKWLFGEKSQSVVQHLPILP